MTKKEIETQIALGLLHRYEVYVYFIRSILNNTMAVVSAPNIRQAEERAKDKFQKKYPNLTREQIGINGIFIVK